MCACYCCCYEKHIDIFPPSPLEQLFLLLFLLLFMSSGNFHSQPVRERLALLCLPGWDSNSVRALDRGRSRAYNRPSMARSCRRRLSSTYCVSIFQGLHFFWAERLQFRGNMHKNDGMLYFDLTTPSVWPTVWLSVWPFVCPSVAQSLFKVVQPCYCCASAIDEFAALLFFKWHSAKFDRIW